MLHREIIGLPTTVYPVDEWALVETAVDEEYIARTETLFSVANGYLGMRGAPDEGRPQFDYGTFVNGFHETWPIHHAEEAFGFARTGQTMISVPDARRFHLYVDDEMFQLTTADLEHYERRLDMRTGQLVRELVWRTMSGKKVRVRSWRMVSMSSRHMAAIRYELTMLDGDAPVVISSQLRHEGARRRAVDLTGDVEATAVGHDPRESQDLGDVLVPEGAMDDGDGRAVLRYRVRNSGMTLACGIDHHVTSDAHLDSQLHHGNDRAKLVLRGRLSEGDSITIDKVAAYATSVATSSARLADRVNRVLDRSMADGLDRLFAEQREWYDEFWHAGDVVIDGSPVVQQAVRWSLFQLIQASARAESTGIPAKGLTGSGYEGHYFWDTEIYVLPYLIHTQPRVARNLLRFRHGLLDSARKRAREVNQEGALFAWRTINGEEASAYYEAGTAQYHINADIMYALRKYVRATGDTEFLVDEGAEMLVETARLWLDLGFFREGVGSFHIYGVTGPDEYTTLVNDNAYTNLMARLNLRYAADVVDELRARRPELHGRLAHRTGLRPDEVEQWRLAADRMFVPSDDRLGITPQDANFLDKEVWPFDDTPSDKYPLLLHFHPLVIYRYQVIKQADIVLAMFLQPDDFDPDLKQRNFDHYDPLTTGDSSLSACIQSIVAAELGDDARAMRYFRLGLYVDLADTAGNVSHGVHVAAAGGVWQSLVYGFAGFRDHSDTWCFEPRLPASWRGMSFALRQRDCVLRVHLDRMEVAYTLEEGEELTLRHHDEEIVLRAGESAFRPMGASVSPPPPSLDPDGDQAPASA